MTTHAELSKQLALALGYYPESVRIEDDVCIVYRKEPAWYVRPYEGRQPRPNPPDTWAEFDYRHPSVAMPLLKWLRSRYGVWTLQERRLAPGYFLEGYRRFPAYDGYFSARADTLEEAIARAVIAVKGGK